MLNKKNALLLASVGLLLIPASKKSGGRNLSPQEIQSLHDLLIHKDIEFVKQGILLLEMLRSDDLEEFCQSLYQIEGRNKPIKTNYTSYITGNIGVQRTKFATNAPFSVFDDFPHAASIRLWAIAELVTFPDWTQKITFLSIGKITQNFYTGKKTPIYIFENIRNLGENLSYLSSTAIGDFSNFFSQGEYFQKLLLLDLENLFRGDSVFPELKPGDFPNLKALKIGNSSLSTLPPSFQYLESLKILTLSSIAITQIPPIVFTLPNLTNLNFSESSISTISPAILQLPKINTLILEHNKLNPSVLPVLAQLPYHCIFMINGNPQLGLYQQVERPRKLQKLLEISQ